MYTCHMLKSLIINEMSVYGLNGDQHMWGMKEPINKARRASLAPEVGINSSHGGVAELVKSRRVSLAIGKLGGEGSL